MRVKDMPRRQQKAVFANMGTTDGSTALESTATYEQKRRYLLSKSDLAETTEDKIFDAMNDKALTHRQKMARVSEIKADAAKRLNALKPSSGQSSGAGVAQTAPIIPKRSQTVRFAAQEKPSGFSMNPQKTQIVQVPQGIGKNAFNAAVLKTKFKSNRLYEHEGLLLTQQEYAEGLRQKGKLPAGSRAIRQPTGISRRAFDETINRHRENKRLFVMANGIALDAKTYSKAVQRTNRVKYGARNWKEKHLQEQSQAIKQAKAGKGTMQHPEDIYIAAHAKHDLTYKSLQNRGVRLNPASDADRDGVVNAKDCRPLDKTKQDRGKKMKKKALSIAEKGILLGGKAIGSYVHKHYTVSGRTKEARERIAYVHRKREAERLEQQAREEEAEYKKEHPSFFAKAKERLAPRKKSIYE